MSTATYLVELQATTAAEIRESDIDDMYAELVNYSPVFSNSSHRFRIHLAVAESSNGFLTGIESVVATSTTLVNTAAAVAGINPLHLTELKVSLEEPNEPVTDQ